MVNVGVIENPEQDNNSGFFIITRSTTALVAVVLGLFDKQNLSEREVCTPERDEGEESGGVKYNGVGQFQCD